MNEVMYLSTQHIDVEKLTEQLDSEDAFKLWTAVTNRLDKITPYGESTDRKSVV